MLMEEKIRKEEKASAHAAARVNSNALYLYACFSEYAILRLANQLIHCMLQVNQFYIVA